MNRLGGPADILLRKGQRGRGGRPQEEKEPPNPQAQETPPRVIFRIEQKDEGMVKVTGVKFRNLNGIYYYNPLDLPIHFGSRVICDTERGIDCGRVVLTPVEMEDDKAPERSGDVIRIATEADASRLAELTQKEGEAFKICREKIKEHKLDMKLIRAEYLFDGSRLIFYFTADGRVDFRRLVKDLAAAFHVRIELRQVGVRDATKLIGGIGICGRPLCCSSFLSSFAPVSIKMAKEQNLAPNPAKISGSCGRLMCCLKNEEETYAYLSEGMPHKGDYMTDADGVQGQIVATDILRQRVRCLVELDGDEREMREYAVSEITFVPRSKRRQEADGERRQFRDKNEGEGGRRQNRDRNEADGEGRRQRRGKGTRRDFKGEGRGAGEGGEAEAREGAAERKQENRPYEGGRRGNGRRKNKDRNDSSARQQERKDGE